MLECRLTYALFSKLFCIPVILLLFASAGVAAETLESVSPEKNAIVAIYVVGRNGTHVASGNGFVVDSRGLIATSCGLVSKWIEKVDNSISVEFEGGSIYPMEHVISNSCANNLVMIKINANGLPSVNIAAAFKPKTGEQVKMISALPAAKKAGEGGVIKTVRQTDNIFQLDLPVKPEHDGSTVFNLKGEVVGIMTFPAKGKDQHLVVPARYILKELNKCRNIIGVAPEVASAPAREVPFPPVPAVTQPDKSAKLPEIKSQNSAEQKFLAANSYEKSNMYKEAVETYRQALALRPDYIDAYVNLGLVYYKIERYAEAIDAYKQALRIKPDTSSIYNKLAAAYIIVGEYSLALDAYKDSLKTDPKNSETHFNLGVTYLLAGDRDGAINEYFILKDLDTNRAEKLLDLIY